MPSMDFIPIQFILDEIDHLSELRTYSIPKIQKDYDAKIKSYRDLISNWTTFGPGWKKRERTSQ